MGGGAEEVFKPVTINGSLVTSGEEIEGAVHLLSTSSQTKATNLIQEIPEDHIVHNVPGNISVSIKYLLFTWEEQNSGWIAENLLSAKKKIRFYGNEVIVNSVPFQRGASVENSEMPSLNFMPGNSFDEKRENFKKLMEAFSL